MACTVYRELFFAWRRLVYGRTQTMRLLLHTGKRSNIARLAKFVETQTSPKHST
jgi:hypothetical protein